MLIKIKNLISEVSLFVPKSKDELEKFKVEPIDFTRVTLEVEKIRIDDILDQYRRKMQDRPLKEMIKNFPDIT